MNSVSAMSPQKFLVSSLTQGESFTDMEDWQGASAPSLYVVVIPCMNGQDAQCMVTSTNMQTWVPTQLPGATFVYKIANASIRLSVVEA